MLVKTRKKPTKKPSVWTSEIHKEINKSPDIKEMLKKMDVTEEMNKWLKEQRRIKKRMKQEEIENKAREKFTTVYKKINEQFKEKGLNERLSKIEEHIIDRLPIFYTEVKINGQRYQISLAMQKAGKNYYWHLKNPFDKETNQYFNLNWKKLIPKKNSRRVRDLTHLGE